MSSKPPTAKQLAYLRALARARWPDVHLTADTIRRHRRDPPAQGRAGL